MQCPSCHHADAISMVWETPCRLCRVTHYLYLPKKPVKWICGSCRARFGASVVAAVKRARLPTPAAETVGHLGPSLFDGQGFPAKSF